MKKTITLMALTFILAINAYAQNMETVFEDLSDRLAPSVVNIISEITTTTQVMNPFDFFDFGPFGGGQPKTEIRKMQGSGTGFIIDAKGYIITNTHVVKGAEKITVILNDGREFPGEAWIDSRTDLALVKIKATDLKPIELGDSDTLKVGQWVMAIGNPYGFENTITTGVISGLSREFAVGESGDDSTYYPDAIQTDASINPGNSGGPLVNLKGQVIGINSAIASPSGGSVGLGFAVPVNTAKFVIERLIKEGKVIRGYFGISTTKLTNAQKNRLKVKEGAYVQTLSKGTPAEEAGIKVEDVITEIDGKAVKSPIDLRRIIEAITPGKEVNVKLTRNEKPLQVKVKVGELPNNDIQPTTKANINIGITVSELTKEIKSQLKIAENTEGVLVKGINKNGPAASSGIQVRDIIIQVNNIPVKTVKDYENALKKLGDASTVTLIILRDDVISAADINL